MRERDRGRKKNSDVGSVVMKRIKRNTTGLVRGDERWKGRKRDKVRE